MTPEERFVRAATRGLSRRKRAEAQAELRSHLHERTQQLILAGKPLPSAQAQAMQELGAPAHIARGLQRTEHVHPLLSTAALTAMAALLLGFPAFDAWQGWRENIYSSNRVTSSESTLRADGATSLPEAQKELAKSGIHLRFFGPWASLEAPGVPAVKLNTTSCPRPVYADPHRNRLWPEVRPSHLFVAVPELTGCLASAGWPLEVRPQTVLFRGNPLPYLPQTLSPQAKVTLPQLHLILQGFLYQKAMTNLLGPAAIVSPIRLQSEAQTYRVNSPPQTPVLLLVRGSADNTYENHFAAFAWVEKGGKVRLPRQIQRSSLKRDSVQPITLYSSTTQWKAAPESVNAGILLPLSTKTAAPLSLTAVPTEPLN